MRVLKPFDTLTVRYMMCGNLPTKAQNLSGFLESKEYEREIQECCDRLNSKRNIWQSLPDDFRLLDDLVATFQATDAGMVVDRIALISLIYGLFSGSAFPWTDYDQWPPRSNAILHMARADAPSPFAWQLYLVTKSMLQDLTVIPEIVATLKVPSEPSPSFTNLRLIHALAYTGSSQVISLLQDLLSHSPDDSERLAIQLELLIFQPRFVSLPVLNTIELERSCLALLALSIHQQAPQPVLLQYLDRESRCRENVRRECIRRPRVRILCRGPGDWAENLIQNLSNPDGDLLQSSPLTGGDHGMS